MDDEMHNYSRKRFIVLGAINLFAVAMVVAPVQLSVQTRSGRIER